MDVRMHYLIPLKTASAPEAEESPERRAVRLRLTDWILFREYWDEGADLGALAARAGVPREEGSSCLWECYGERFYTVRKRLRIADAKALLIKRSEMSLSSVSRTVGFPDKSDFRRAFREETGCSPKLWRENGGSIVRCRISQILEKGRNRFRDSRTNA